MRWLKSLDYKRFLKISKRSSSEAKKRFPLVLPWNQTTKVVTGLFASVFSMMALITFFGSLEQPASINSTLSEAGDLGFELGESDQLSLEFGLDATLPTREPDLMTTGVSSSEPPKSIIKTVSVQQSVGTDQQDPNVHHAVGIEFGNSNSSSRVEQIAGERTMYVNGFGPEDNTSRSTDVGAVWLTGEIEEVDDLPVNGSARRVRNQ